MENYTELWMNSFKNLSYLFIDTYLIYKHTMNFYNRILL
jgi:hypothetical protein